MDIKLGATLTGGTTTTVAPSAFNGNRVTFTTPTHTRLQPQTIQFSVAQAPLGGKDPVASAGMKIVFAERVTEEGCCTVREGAATADFGFRWNLSQSVDTVDDVLEYLRGLVFTTEFRDMIVKGILPQ